MSGLPVPPSGPHIASSPLHPWARQPALASPSPVPASPSGHRGAQHGVHRRLCDAAARGAGECGQRAGRGRQGSGAAPGPHARERFAGVVCRRLLGHDLRPSARGEGTRCAEGFGARGLESSGARGSRVGWQPQHEPPHMPGHRVMPPTSVCPGRRTCQATDLPTATVEAAKRVRADLPTIASRGYDDTRVIHGVFGSACYVTGARGWGFLWGGEGWATRAAAPVPWGRREVRSQKLCGSRRRKQLPFLTTSYPLPSRRRPSCRLLPVYAVPGLQARRCVRRQGPGGAPRGQLRRGSWDARQISSPLTAALGPPPPPRPRRPRQARSRTRCWPTPTRAGRTATAGRHWAR